MFKIVRELKTQYLYAYFTVYAGGVEVASFPSPETFPVIKGGRIVDHDKANPLYGKSSPTFHSALSREAQSDLCSFMGRYCAALKNKKPLPTIVPLNVYDTFYQRNEG